MNNGLKVSALLGAGLILWAIDVPVNGAPFRQAHAIVGAPLTPMSYAGVARRTTRRVVATEAAVATTAVAASAATASATAASARPPAPVAAPAPAAPPVGTIVTALPPGCEQAMIGGVAYSYCGGVYYRAGFQGANVVYVVAQP
jgi:hypothetical protein